MSEHDILLFARSGLAKRAREIANKMPDMEMRVLRDAAEELLATMYKIDWISKEISNLDETSS